MGHDYIPSLHAVKIRDYFSIFLKNIKMEKGKKNWRGYGNMHKASNSENIHYRDNSV